VDFDFVEKVHRSEFHHEGHEGTRRFWGQKQLSCGGDDNGGMSGLISEPVSGLVIGAAIAVHRQTGQCSNDEAGNSATSQRVDLWQLPPQKILTFVKLRALRGEES
jgi:hypothetical protein